MAPIVKSPPVAASPAEAPTVQGEVDRGSHVEDSLGHQLAALGRTGAQVDELFRMLVESVRDYAIFMLDPTGHVATWNAGAARFKGYAASEIVGRHFSAFYPDVPGRAETCALELEVAMRDGRFEDEGWRVRKDGSQFWANVVITAVRDAAGTLVGFAKVTRDLTERKLAEEQRLAAEERFRLFVESVSDYAILILDPGGNVASWNAGAARINGYTAEEIIGSHFSRFYPVETAGRCDVELETARRDGRFEDEGWRVRKGGSRFWANVVISAIRDRTGRLVGFSKVTRDLTELKRAEEERTALLAAEQTNRTKDEFLAMLGHELRNPLAPIVTALQLLKVRDQPRWDREHEIIERQVNQMIRLVDDLLDVARIARGKIELRRGRLDLRVALAQAVEIASPLFTSRGQHFVADLPAQPLVVDGDEARLIQVFSNLLNNASKYTEPNGHVRLTAQQVDDRAAIEVQDNGPGIAPELLPRVFDLFVQGSQQMDRANGGLGLGLAVVRSIIVLHGGDVEVRSGGERRGSSFTVRLPLGEHATAPAPDLVPASGTAAPRASYRVLLVDDNHDARALLAELLSSSGHDVTTAADGPSALEALAHGMPQIAVLDIGLPGMDGYELATRIRARPDGDKIRIIALTGYGQARDQARSDAAGFDYHFVKPVDIERLLLRIADPPR